MGGWSGIAGTVSQVGGDLEWRAVTKTPGRGKAAGLRGLRPALQGHRETQKLSSGAEARFGDVATWGLKPPPPKEKAGARFPFEARDMRKAGATGAKIKAGCSPIEAFGTQTARLRLGRALLRQDELKQCPYK